MIASWVGMNRINNELVRTQNELMLPELKHFASFAVHDLFHRKERREHREKLQSILIPVMAYEKAAASRFRTRMTRIARIFTDMCSSASFPIYVLYCIYSLIEEYINPQISQIRTDFPTGGQT